MRTVTKRALSAAGAAVIGGLLSLAAAQAAKMITFIGSSPTSWEEAIGNALDEARPRDQILDIDKVSSRVSGGQLVEYTVQVRVEAPYP